MTAASQFVDARAALMHDIEAKGAELFLLVTRARNLIVEQRLAVSGKTSVSAVAGDDGESAVRTTHQVDHVETARLDTAQPERWASIGATHFQEGLMALTRSIEQPEHF